MKVLMIKSTEYVREGLRRGLRESSESQEGSSSLLSLREPLFRLVPICSSEEVWFLVVLDSDSYYPVYSLGLRALVMTQGAVEHDSADRQPHI